MQIMWLKQNSARQAKHFIHIGMHPKTKQTAGSVYTRVCLCVCVTSIVTPAGHKHSVDACEQEARSSMPTPNQYAFFKPHFCLKKIGRLTNTSTVSTRSPNEK